MRARDKECEEGGLEAQVSGGRCKTGRVSFFFVRFGP